MEETRRQKLVLGGSCFQLTDMRLRNMMWDSGTPLLISSLIACTAEFPVPRIGSSKSTCLSEMSEGSFSYISCWPLSPSLWIRIFPILMPLQHALKAFSMLSPLFHIGKKSFNYIYGLLTIIYLLIVSLPSDNRDTTQPLTEVYTRIHRS